MGVDGIIHIIEDVEHAIKVALLYEANIADSDVGSDIDTSDLPPLARRDPDIRSNSLLTPGTLEEEGVFNYPTSGQREAPPVSASAAIRQLFTANDPQALFKQLDEEYIKPHLLLDSGNGSGGSSSRGNGEGPSS